MEVWKKFGTLECGINDDGKLFLGDDRSGYNMPDTPRNRERILSDFYSELGYDYVGSIGKYDTFRKVVYGCGKWIAEDTESGEFFPITYQQALGHEPIRPTGIESLARELGRTLLP